jgi:hypothetical protein
MRKTILAVLVPVIAAFTVQAAAAAQHHHARTKGRAVASERFRNSNAYAAPGDVGVAPRFVVPPTSYNDTPSYNDPSKFGGETALPIQN